MTFTPHDWTPWLALAASTAGTYICRATGVALSDRIQQQSEFFGWLSAVTYAMVASLTVKMLFMPVSPLAKVPLWIRMGACVVSLLVLLLAKRGLFVALLVGASTVFLYGMWHT
jgi:branched-subunit amino acid transport protein